MHDNHQSRKPRRSRKLNAESLEPRRMLAGVTLNNGVLTVSGTEGDDVITILESRSQAAGDQLVVFAQFLDSPHRLSSDEVTLVAIDGFAGDDTITVSGLNVPTRLYGHSGNDRIFGASAKDTIFGGDGDDVLYGKLGDDLIFGGNGDDLIVSGDGHDRIEAGGGHDRVFGGSGADHLNGNAGDDLVFGGAGVDLIFGSLGDDRLGGGEGNDSIYGGLGDDLITGDSGSDKLHGSEGTDRLLGGFGADSIFGGQGNDVIAGGMNEDELHGEDGDDLLFGDEDADKLFGDDGNDRLFGGVGSDIVSGGTGDDDLNGGAGADLLNGGRGNDQLYGGDQNDILISGGTAWPMPEIVFDRMLGQNGSDLFLNAFAPEYSTHAEEFDSAIERWSQRDGLERRVPATSAFLAGVVPYFSFVRNIRRTDYDLIDASIGIVEDIAGQRQTRRFVAADDEYEFGDSDTLTVNLDQGLLMNDMFLDFSTGSAVRGVGVRLVRGPEHGQLEMELNGSFTYTRQTSGATTDSFEYELVLVEYFEQISPVDSYRGIVTIRF
ncbi:MAG: Ig-like domain-containing protein [Planctomycetota bacterium]